MITIYNTLTPMPDNVCNQPLRIMKTMFILDKLW